MYFLENMRKRKEVMPSAQIKNEIRTWYAFEGPLGTVVNNKQFFFAWKEGCLMGTPNILDEAIESLVAEKDERQSEAVKKKQGRTESWYAFKTP